MSNKSTHVTMYGKITDTEILEIISVLNILRASLVAQRLKRLPTMRETWVRSLGWEDPLEKEMAIHSSILAWRIPWTEEPGGLQSTGSQRVGHYWATSLHFNILICPGILMENLMTSQKLTKGLNELANMLITFMVCIWKITGLNLTFSGSRENLPLKLIMTILW